jgi:hypothetical protein
MSAKGVVSGYILLNSVHLPDLELLQPLRTGGLSRLMSCAQGMQHNIHITVIVLTIVI